MIYLFWFFFTFCLLICENWIHVTYIIDCAIVQLSPLGEKQSSFTEKKTVLQYHSNCGIITRIRIENVSLPANKNHIHNVHKRLKQI